MTFSQSVRTVMFDKYATFSGRASRSEYWWFSLFCFLMALALTAFFVLSGGGAWLSSLITLGQGQGDFAPLGTLPKLVLIIYLLFSLAILIPSIAVLVRRFHDRNLSGWWVLGVYVLMMIPIVGMVAAIGLLVFLCLKGSSGDNKFGVDPLA